LKDDASHASIQSEMMPSLTRSPKRRTQNPAATHCVLVTTVCRGAPTHPIRRPLRFRFMLLRLVFLLDGMLWRGCERAGGRGIKSREVNGFGADEETTSHSLWMLPKDRGAVFF
jgi:hypothetical protein